MEPLVANQMFTENYNTVNTILELPPEIILKILSYLSISDLKETSLVCSSWYKITQHPSVGKRLLFRISKYKKKSKFTRIFHNVHIDNIKLSSKFPFENNVQYIALNECKIRSKDFLMMLKKAKSLKTLIITECDFDQIPNKLDILRICGELKNIKELTIYQYYTRINVDNFFETLMCVMPNIEKLDIQVALEINNKEDGYLWGQEMGIQPMIIIKYITKLAFKLKYLALDFLTDIHFIQQLSNIENLRLTTLTIDYSTVDIEIFLLKQHYLTSLTILRKYGQSYKIENNYYLPICNNLKNLNTLISTEYYDSYKEDIYKDLWKLKRLKIVKISNNFVSKDVLMKGLFKEKNSHLKELHLKYLEFNILCEIADKFQNLTVLNIVCRANITNYDIQIIWKNLRWLRKISLVIFGSSKITDYAFTGIPETNEQVQGYSITQLKGLRIIAFAFDSTKLTQELIFELAKLKELNVLRLCTMNILLEDILVLKECKELQFLFIRMHSKFKKSKFKIIFKKLRQYFPRPKHLNFGKYFVHFYSDSIYNGNNFKANDLSDNFYELLENETSQFENLVDYSEDENDDDDDEHEDEYGQNLEEHPIKHKNEDKITFKNEESDSDIYEYEFPKKNSRNLKIKRLIMLFFILIMMKSPFIFDN